MADERLEELELEKMASAWGLSSKTTGESLIGGSNQVNSKRKDTCYDLGSKVPPPDAIRDRRLYRKPVKPLDQLTRDDMIRGK